MSFARRPRGRLVRGAQSRRAQRSPIRTRQSTVRKRRPTRLRDWRASNVEWLESRQLLAVWHVSLAGNDANDGSAGSPLRSVQAAVSAASAAADGADRILIAGGTYDNASFDGAIAVADAADLETLSLEGGYAADFLSRDIVNTPTIYVPQSASTGIAVGDASVTIDGLQLVGAGLAVVIDINNDAATVRDVTIAGGGVGVAADLVASPSLVRVHVQQTTDAAFALDQLTGPIVLDNLSATENDGDGLRATALAGDATIQAGTFSDNLGDGLAFTNVNKVSVLGATATGNARGLAIDTANGVFLTNGVYTNNLDAGIALSRVALPGAIITGVQASATAGIGLHVVDTIGVQLTEVQLSSAAPHAGAVLESTAAMVYIASSAADNDLLQFRNGLLTHKRNDLVRATVQIEPSTVMALSGGAGNDTLTIGTGSGYQDIVDISVGSVAIRRGPTPLEAAVQSIGYDAVETLTISTEGGSDTVTVTLAATGSLPNVLNLNSDDEDDGIEINHVVMNRAITINLDGGAGTNGLTVFTRGSERDRVTIHPASMIVRPGPPSPPRPDQTTNMARINALSVYSGDGDDTIELRLGGMTNGIPIHAHLGGGDNDDLRILAESGYEDIVRITHETVAIQFGPNPQSAVPRTFAYPGAEIIELFTAGGSDTITVIDPAVGALPRGIAISGQDEDDFIQLILGNRTVQNAFVMDGGGGTNNQFELFTNSGYEDVVSMDGLTVTGRIGPNPNSALPKISSLVNIQHARIRTAGGADSVTVTPASSGSYVSRLEILTEDENDAIAINKGTSALGATINVDGGNGDGDALTINDIPNTNGHIEVDTVAAPGVFGAQRVELLNLLGSTGADTITNKTAIFAFLNGGPGNDLITGGPGFEVLLGGAGNDTMIGGGGIDVLLGSAGNDVLFGGAGRDLLIGGTGGDFLDGGTEDDILIAGTTSFDDQQTALDAILSEWTSFRPYLTRVANLSGTGTGPRQNGNIFLIAGVTVFEDISDPDIDTLIGGGGNDFYFLNVEEDLLDDLTSPEVSVNVVQGN